MDRLPPEIIAYIASFLLRTLEDGKRKPLLMLMAKQGYQIPGHETNPPLVRPALATLSRRWQLAVESTTFREIRLSSVDLDDFRRFFLAESNRHRRPLLRTLLFTVLLPSRITAGAPSDDEDSLLPYETDLDRQKNDEAATKVIRALFDILSQWPAEATVGFSLSLQSPLESRYRNSDSSHYSYTRLLDNPSSPLPTLPCIKSFTT